MRIALINPNLSGSVSSLDMGVAYLATYLDERTGHDVKIIDLSFHKKDWKKHLLKNINSFKPEAVGISVVSLHLEYSKQIAREIKKAGNIPIIVGGCHPTLEPEETINITDFDALCIGDGELTISEYLDCLENKKGLAGVKGLWYKKNSEIFRNELRELIQDLDSLPIPNYDLWEDLSLYLYFLQRMYFIGVRGCPYSCTYCDERPLSKANKGKRFRFRNPRAFAREIKCQWEKYKDKGMETAHIFDAVFTFDKEWLKEFCDEYKKIGLADRLSYTVFIKADEMNSEEEKVKLLSESGCRQVRVGIESGNEEIRSNLFKKINSPNEQIEKAIATYKKYNMLVKGYNIYGAPKETKATMMETFSFNKKLRPHFPVFFTYAPLPGTELADCADIVDDKNKYSFHSNKALKLEGVPQDYPIKMQRRSYLYFVPRIAWRIFKNYGLKFPVFLAQRMFRAARLGAQQRIVIGYVLNSPVFWEKQIRNP